MHRRLQSHQSNLVLTCNYKEGNEEISLEGIEKSGVAKESEAQKSKPEQECSDLLKIGETIEKHSTGFERTFDYCDKNKVKYGYEDTGLGFRFTFYRKNVHGHVQINLNERDNKMVNLLTDIADWLK